MKKIKSQINKPWQWKQINELMLPLIFLFLLLLIYTQQITHKCPTSLDFIFLSFLSILILNFHFFSSFEYNNITQRDILLLYFISYSLWFTLCIDLSISLPPSRPQRLIRVLEREKTITKPKSSSLPLSSYNMIL